MLTPSHSGGALIGEIRYLTVDYGYSNFSVSQALFAPDSAAQIEAIPAAESSTTTENTPNDAAVPTLPPITKITYTKSHSLPTAAKAGIAIAVIVLALLGVGLAWHFGYKKRKSHRHRRGNSGNSAELASDPTVPRDAAELENHNTPLSGKKGANVTVDEKYQDGIYQDEVQLMDQGCHGPAIELRGDKNSRPELPSPEPYQRFELPSSEPVLRSELSTPEPGWPAEMPSPDMGGTTVGEPSPPLDAMPSPLSSPSSLWTGRSLQRRPTHIRMDSSEAESWPRTATSVRSRPSLRRSRMISSESNTAPPTSDVSANRPSHQRLDSADSISTFETRMEMPSASPFFTAGPPYERSVPEVLAVAPRSSSPAQASSAMELTRSALTSPEPLVNARERTEPEAKKKRT